MKQIKSKERTRKGIIKLSKKNERENRPKIEKINWPKIGSLQKFNKFENQWDYLRKKERKHKLLISMNKGELLQILKYLRDDAKIL